MKLFSELKDYPIMFVQKKRLWHWQLWYLNRKHVKIIYDFDDAVMFKSPVDGGGRSFKRQRTFARMVRYSDQVIAGNQYLKSQAMPYNKNIIILPTAIDTSKYTMKDYRRSKGHVTIGWIGSKSSLPFLKELTPAFDQLASQYNSLELKIICNDFFECNKMPVIKKMWAREDENSDLQDIDIGLAPLPNHEWTKGKCATKLLQYLSVGIPVVCSPVGVHTEIVKEGINGLFATSNQEWIDKIKLLIRDKMLRERIGLEGRKTVDLSYSLKANTPKFINAIKGI
jgi:glycosyltransferase involved in cell wall biosynthesis